MLRNQGSEHGAESGRKSAQSGGSNSIRASKYGNFYRPHGPEASSELSSELGESKKMTAVAKKREQSPRRQIASNSSMGSENLIPSSNSSAGSRGKSRDSSPVGRPNLIVNNEANKSEKEQLKNGNSSQPAATRMQFNIPPPPQVKLINGKSSMVSYAKSRIYDKPTKQVSSNPFNQQQHLNQASLLNDVVGKDKIPNSILCGFKPPKQVNVSKAREKWEGGEPFAKCKSRQRHLALQASKKFVLGGSWSMTNVVATQQLQFQANSTRDYLFGAGGSSSSPAMASRAIKDDPSVKVLTRGSVLERVQQFEKVDPAGSNGSSLKSSPSSSSIESGSSQLSDESSSSDNEDFVDQQAEISLTMRQPAGPAQTASYRPKVSSIQEVKREPQQAAFESSFNKSSFAQQAAMKNFKPSLRRKSSLGVQSASSQSSLIPKFYHLNGKPNTYEIELQKKNIVACFDKFPDRKASLAVGNYKRHFHSIALACGFSEYFKEPLFLYIKYKILNNSNLLHSNQTSGPITRRSENLLQTRKQSVVSLSPVIKSPTSSTVTRNLNNNSIGKKLLVKSNSIDQSTVERAIENNNLHSQNFLTCEQFLICWKQLIESCFDLASKFVHLLTFGQRNYLLQDDFIPLIQSIIDDHPGLKFLRSAPDFHMRYIQTVIARIYFNVNKSWTGKISLIELRKSNLLNVLKNLSQVDDINQITDYFSYEHFYVIYCKFWNLDQDHDLLISKEDLARHNDAAISSRIIERIFMGIVSRDLKKFGNKMTYSDFVWFLLAEEDKKHPRSIEYWFRLMDLDGDGYISMYEMEYFYYEQIKRLELMNIEALPFIDSACQIFDLVNPKEKFKISLQDLKRTKMATIFFDTFINLEKYLEHESREFVSTRDTIQDGQVISDWDRYANEEYENLVTEETSV